MKEKFIICSIVILFGGCPKRHTGPQIVYVPAPPPAARSAATNPQQPAEAMVIQVPQPPPPPETPPPEAPPPEESSPHHPRRNLHNPPRPNEVAPEPEPADLPALELGGNLTQGPELRSQVVKLQQDVQQRIGHIRNTGLSRTERNTLAGARAFLDQSVRALQQSDLRRALNLAQKAYLLAEALQQSQ